MLRKEIILDHPMTLKWLGWFLGRNITKMGHSHRIWMKIGPDRWKNGSGGRFFRSWVEKMAKKGQKRPKTGKKKSKNFQKFSKNRQITRMIILVILNNLTSLLFRWHDITYILGYLFPKIRARPLVLHRGLALLDPWSQVKIVLDGCGSVPTSYHCS